ncbi:conserved Plasmodium protein, unknown function [Plasmodium reichenowi]|uniref:Uncharacterized protein n=1 Tax=Plasmodium reichenowi TaxID=5854 RepID=A0A2P9DMV1_PLARE|nr:conserved Plasmodium protein, unknown function [Plasmodium reichenowi]
MVSKKEARFYLSNHLDNINSAKFYEENVLISCCDCGMDTLWDLDNRKCIRNYKVSSYSCLYSDFLK